MFSRLDNLFKQLMVNLGKNKQLHSILVFYSWTDVVGERISKVASPDRIANGVLYVKTISSSWAQELTLLKNHIAKELNVRLGGEFIKEIYFSSGLYSSPKQKDGNHMAVWEQMNLSKEELRWLEEEVAPIWDPELKNQVRHIRIKEEKIKRFKMRQGFKPCKTCGTLIPISEECSFCKTTAS